MSRNRPSARSCAISRGRSVTGCLRASAELAPTAEAQLLFRDADKIFREVGVLRGFSDRVRDKQTGILRIGASAPPTFALLPCAVESSRRRNPGTRMALQTLPAQEIGQRILIGDIDLGLTMAAIDEPQIRSEKIGNTEIVVVMRSDSPLAELGTVGPTDLAGQMVISYGPQPHIGMMLDRMFLELGREMSTQIEVTLSISALPLVAQGLGIALVDGLVPWARFSDLTVRPFRPRQELDILLSTNTAFPVPRLAAEITRDLKAAMAEVDKDHAPPMDRNVR